MSVAAISPGLPVGQAMDQGQHDRRGWFWRARPVRAFKSAIAGVTLIDRRNYDLWLTLDSDLDLDSGRKHRGRSKTTIERGTTSYDIPPRATPHSTKSCGLGTAVSTILFHSCGVPS